MNSDYPLSKEEFNEIYSKVPRLSVEVLLIDKQKGIYLTKRSIEPCKDQWHLPGGTVYFGEQIQDAVKRVAQKELGIEVTSSHFVGYIEYPSHYENGLDSPVSLAFEVDGHKGIPKPVAEASKGEWFKSIPPKMHADQDEFLVNSGYLAKP